jgi:tetratricopeptide (TPR) repeat protein
MKHLLVSALLLVAASLPGQAQADQQPSAADRTTARRLGNEGVIALKNGEYDTAADRFERANDLVNAPSFLVLLARARVGQGRLVEAYEIYRTIIREGVQPDKPEAFKRALAEAKAEVKGLEPRLAWVAVNVVGARPEQVEVTLNGSVIPSAALGAQRPADPGVLRVEAKAEGYRTAERVLELTEGQHLAPIELRLVELPKPTVAAPVKLDQPVMTADGGEPPFISQNTLGYVALGLGAAGIAVGTVTGIMAINRRQELDDFECYQEVGNTCYLVNDPETVNAAVSAKDDLDTFAAAATISFIAGGALAATGIILLVTAADEPAEVAGASVRPYVGLGSIGAVGTF